MKRLIIVYIDVERANDVESRILPAALDTAASSTISRAEAAICLGYDLETVTRPVEILTGSGIEYTIVRVDCQYPRALS